MIKRLGFTLIELILTLTLISILLLIAIPKTNIYSNYYKNMELNVLRRDLYATRARAVSEGRTYVFHFVHGGYSYIIENDKSNFMKRVNLEDVQILSSDHRGFYFTAEGSVTNPDTIRLRSKDGKIYHLKVGVATGKITIEEVSD